MIPDDPIFPMPNPMPHASSDDFHLINYCPTVQHLDVHHSLDISSRHLYTQKPSLYISSRVSRSSFASSRPTGDSTRKSSFHHCLPSFHVFPLRPNPRPRRSSLPPATSYTRSISCDQGSPRLCLSRRYCTAADSYCLPGTFLSKS